MTPNDRNHYQDWDLFALGFLDEQEQRDMASHLDSGCEVCAKLYLSAEAVVAGLAALSPDVPLPPGAEMRLRERLRPAVAPIAVPLGSTSQARRSIRAVVPWVLAAACLIAAIGSEVSRRNISREFQERQRQNAAYRLRDQQSARDFSTFREKTSAEITGLQSTIEGLKLDLRTAESAKLADRQQLRVAQQQIAEANTRIHELNASVKNAEARRSQIEEELSATHLRLAKVQEDKNRWERASAENERILNLLESPSLSQLDLKPIGGTQSSARVFWQNDRGLLLVARNLPPLRDRESFQLWFYRKGTPDVVNVGTVNVGQSGSGLLFVPPGPALLSMSGALITEQPATSAGSVAGEEILKVKP